MNVTGVVMTMKTVIRISCSTKRVCNTEKKSIEALSMLPIPNVLPKVGQQSANEHERRRDDGSPARQVGGVCHSITSPRMRNLAKAAVETKPTTAMTMAASR